MSESAKQFPLKIAVRSKDDSIRYAELEKWADTVASALQYFGLTRGSRVAIYLDKSISSVAAIVGVLRAGCVYVPLDPASPANRLIRIMDDCEAEVVITDQGRAKRWGEIHHKIQKPVKVMNVNDIGKPPPAKAMKHSPDDLAYILYTSGSTGTPKGVTLTHRNALAFVEWAAEYLEIDSSDVLASHAPFHFDLSIFDIFATLLSGAELCLVPSGISYFPLDLAEFIEKNKVTVWYSVPSVLVQLVTNGEIEKRNLETLRSIIYAGEIFQYRYLNQLRRLLPKTEIVNFYGPTETNVITYLNLKDVPGELAANVSLGRPCPYAEILVIGENGRLANVDEEGELIVRSSTTMIGYWGESPGTSKAIKPFGGGSYYFTGDIVSKDSEGNFHFKGRRDHMVKSRGFRIELGDVESALLKIDSVGEAVVIAIPDLEIGNRLKAFVKLKSAVEVDEIKRLCAQFVPPYMIPENIQVVKELPQTSTGKIDRQALKSY